MYEPIIFAVPEAVEVEQDDDATYSTQVTVALNHRLDRAVAVRCELVYTTNHGSIPASSWFHEFKFAIAVIDRTGIEMPFLTQDRDIARNYLPQSCVALIMPVVLRSLEALIDRVRPKILYRVTKSRNSSEKALKNMI